MWDRRWSQNNPVRTLLNGHTRRARKKENGGIITKKEWEELLEKYNYTCLSCGRTDVKLTLDHVVPIFLGGENLIKNAQPLCKSCNSKKHTKIIDYRKEFAI
ncbi:MAG: HNH endonuclease [Alphaproteobacteria bacterium]|nr:MAG: HNH endonuclease [Alphaproteobacteria bacterium]